MMKQWKRWSILLLLTLITLISLIGWHNSASAQSPSLQSAGLTLEKVDRGIYALIASTDYPPKAPNIAICNGGIIIGSDGVLVIDPFHNKALAELMFATVASLTDKPIRYVFNTHYHFDHTGGNPAAEAKGIGIVGRGPIREFMIEKNKELDPTPTPPDLIINSESTIWLGDRKVELEKVEGHSSGTDMIAYIPDSKVVFAGDILFNQRIPYVSDGNIRQWQNTLAQLIKTYPDTKIIPGHGAVSNKQGLETLQQYFTDLEKLALSWQGRSLTKAEVVKNHSQIPERYKDYKFQGLYPGNLETAYQQITLN